MVIYIGIKGYFTDTTVLSKLNIDINDESVHKLSSKQILKSSQKIELDPKIESVRNYMEDQKPFLNPDLNLVDLAKELNMNRAQLSEVINSGFSKNFNDFINEYRISAFKTALQEGRQDRGSCESSLVPV